MKSKFTTVLAIFGIFTYLSSAAIRHPVRKEIVEEIRKLTDKWEPREVHHNPLSSIPAE